ncbi:MAG TPA: DUF6544 family protein [Flavisolibacter sp.]|nr:DUF6544 family protein [Flavisolibacter sp.]
MKTVLIILVFFHGLLHLPGFSKAFSDAYVPCISINISRFNGMLWLTAALLMISTALLYFLKKEWWWIPAIVGLLLSQYLILLNWHEAKFGTIINVLLLFVILISVATAFFKAQYQSDVGQRLQLQANKPAEVLTEQDIKLLPPAIQKYLHYCGVVGKPKVNHFKVELSGQLRKDARSAWMPVTSTQYNFVDSTCRFFFMNATMNKLPVAGYHRFAAGKATMDIRLLSLLKVQYKEGKEMNIAETVTFFNDMCCMAPATLIDKRIQWLEADDCKVIARFTSQDISVMATLYFSKNGALINFASGDRYAIDDNNNFKKTPWSTPIRGYKTINGYQLPAMAETIYNFPNEDFCYGSFIITNVEYNPKGPITH